MSTQDTARWSATILGGESDSINPDFSLPAARTEPKLRGAVAQATEPTLSTTPRPHFRMEVTPTDLKSRQVSEDNLSEGCGWTKYRLPSKEELFKENGPADTNFGYLKATSPHGTVVRIRFDYCYRNSCYNSASFFHH